MQVSPKEAVVSIDLDADGANSLAQIIAFVRRTRSVARPEISLATGLSRALATKYIDIALGQKLLRNGKVGQSSGGRAPRMVDFNSNAGSILAAELGATGFSAAVSDLYGNLISTITISVDIAQGPEAVLSLVESTFDELIAKFKIRNLWGIGIGVPGPVEFATGLPVSPPIMPGWHKFPLRQRFSSRYKVPVWVDNDVNLMALGEHALRKDPITNELIFVKIGSGIGAGILTHGLLHRGAQGCAGDIGHIAISSNNNVQCRCGNVGCLEAISGGLALIRDAELAAANNQSAYLNSKKKARTSLKVRDVIEGSNNGDRWCVERIVKVGNDLGGVLATLVNFHNPSLIVIGGSVSAAGDKLLASIRESVLKRSLPLATRDLQIRISESSDEAGLLGAVEMVISELFSSENLLKWIAAGQPNKMLIDQ